MRTFGAVLIAGLAVSGWVTVAVAGPPTEHVRRYTDHVQQILDDPSMKSVDKRVAVRKVAEEVFDVQETAKRALGHHWQKRTPAEQEEFVQLFADLLERSYIAKIDLYSGERLQYVGETVDGDYATVKARVTLRQGTDVPIDAKLLKRSERWLIYDISIENVSLVGNYRTQFDRIIRTSSFAELIRRLKTKRDEFLPASREARPSPS